MLTFARSYFYLTTSRHTKSLDLAALRLEQTAKKMLHSLMVSHENYARISRSQPCFIIHFSPGRRERLAMTSPRFRRSLEYPVQKSSTYSIPLIPKSYTEEITTIEYLVR